MIQVCFKTVAASEFVRRPCLLSDVPSSVSEATYPVRETPSLVSETLLSVSEAVSSQLTYSNVQHGRTWVLDMLDMRFHEQNVNNQNHGLLLD